MFETTHYQILSSKIPSGAGKIRIAHLSDLHNREYGRGNRLLIGSIERQNPDLIAVTGDVLNSNRDDGMVFVSLARRLAEKTPVFFAEGNHELMLRRHRPGAYLKMFRALADAGVHILQNETEEFRVRGAVLRISGYKIPRRFYLPKLRRALNGVGDVRCADVSHALGQPKDGFRLLLAHAPFFFDAYAGWGADLVLAGHVHGGHIRLPGLGGLLSPDMTFFPRYSEGLFCQNGSRMIVSRGLGSNRKPRINCPPELVFVTLAPGGQTALNS